MPDKESGALTFTTPTDREIVITRVFDAPRQRLFEAYTNPKHLSQWLLGPPGWTMPVCEADVRPGGAWHFVWRKADGQRVSHGQRGFRAGLRHQVHLTRLLGDAAV